KYKAFIPQEGGFIQKEGVGIVKGTKNKKLAESFVNFMLSKEFQEEIPLHQWMFPVMKIQMPDAFKYAVKPEKLLDIDTEKVSKNLEKWLDEWEELMQ
ncbi:MAG: ABC transporter substrate-binding protein, partial [Candidatus Cloacimonadota bacterium]|nr:ABC transporter substrate-binding protein [Candidatus Cloacimonadota bacterium]